MFKVEVKGIKEVNINITEKMLELDAILLDEIEKMGEHLRSESIKECPVDTGRLRASAIVTPVQKEGNEYYCEVGYGTEYAIYVHERTELKHKVGKAKYLEDPYKRNYNFYNEWFEEIVRRVFR